MRFLATGVLILLLGLAIAPAAAQDLPLLTGQQAAPEDDQPDGPIAREAEQGEDQAIQRRLEAIFANLEGLENIRVMVRSGVVELTGEALTAGDHDQALGLARKVEGVVAVEDRISEVYDVQRRVRPLLQRLEQRLYGLITWLPLLTVALAILLLFWLLARLVVAWQWPFRRLTPNPFISDLVRQLVQGIIIVGGLLLALEVLDATALAGTVLGAAGLLGLAVGFALRDTVENYIASILLSLRQPFQPNDHVVIEGYEGLVVRLTSRATILLTLEGNHVRIPNATVFNGIVLNYTRNPARRFDFAVGVDSGSDLVQAQRLCVETLRALEGVLDEPPPLCWIEELGDFSVVLRIVGWVDQRRTEFIKVRSESIRLVKEALEGAGIILPEPIYNLRLSQPGQGGTATEPPPSAPQGLPAGPRPAMDLSRDTHLDRQVEQDRRVTGEENLLDSRAPLE